MPQAPDDAFQQFTIQRKKDLQRVARHTHGEYQFGDVVHEAWLMASNLQRVDGRPLDLLDASDQHRLLSYLYQQLVRYTEQNVRYAVRLDHAPNGSDQSEDVHPLAYLLVSNGGRSPLDVLLEKEDESALESGLSAHGSLAAAYAYLLRKFDNNMSAISNHLRISRSYAYHRCANARWLVTHARHIPMPPLEHFMPGPWRNFRLRHPQVQLAFNFDDELPF